MGRLEVVQEWFGICFGVVLGIGWESFGNCKNDRKFATFETCEGFRSSATFENCERFENADAFEALGHVGIVQL